MDPNIHPIEENQITGPHYMGGHSGEIEFETSPFWPKHLVDLFFRPRKFFSSQIALNKTPYFLFVTWCFGIANVIQRIENRMARAEFGQIKRGWHELLPYLTNSWLNFWGFVLAAGVISAAFIWLLGGWWYRVRIKWSGSPDPDKRLARLTYVYASFVATGTSVLLALIYTVLYPNYQQAWSADESISLIWLIFPFWSCIVSYKGVVTLFDVKKTRATLWFLIAPALVYALALGVMTAMYTLYGKYAYHSEPQWHDYKGGLHLVLKMAAGTEGNIDIEDAESTRQILTARLSQFGIRNKILRLQKDGTIVVQTPYYKDPERLIKLLTKPANLEFRLVDDRSDELANNPDKIPPGTEILYKADPVADTGGVIKIPFLVQKRARLTGANIKHAEVGIDSRFNEPYISIEFDAKGARLFEKITGENIRRRLAIVIDQTVYSAPVIQEKISGGQARISGRFDAAEAADLALLFRTPPLPAKIELVERKTLNKDIWLGPTRD